MEEEQIQISPPRSLLTPNQHQQLVDAATVFCGTALVQLVIPAPLDSLLLPAAVSYWYIKSGQHSWVVDEIHARSQKIATTIQGRAMAYVGSFLWPSKDEE